CDRWRSCCLLRSCLPSTPQRAPVRPCERELDERSSRRAPAACARSGVPARVRPAWDTARMIDLGAVLTAIVTPFDAEENVNEEAFVALMRHLADNGSDGFVVAGTTGEASTLTDEEQLGLIELAVAERPAGKTVVAGTGTNDTRHAVSLTERASALGVDAVLSVTPYYNKP